MTNLSAALPIDLSYAETHNFTCPRCGQPFSAEIWLIVDAGARPDLLARIRGGEMHAVACPTCGPLGMVDAPLLIYRRDAEPAVLFSPAQQTSTEQDRTNALDLMERLRASLGDAWQEEWTAQGISGVQRAMLPAVLSDDPEAALRQMQREMDEALERLRTEDPEAFRQLEKAAREAASSTQRRQDAGDAEDDDSDEDEELPPALAAALAEVIDELRDAGVTIASPEDLETALAARPDLQARLERAASATDLPGSPAASRKVDADTFAESLPDVLNRFLAAETWDESQRIVEQHPQLLSDEADARFALALEENADDPDGVAFFSEHRSLLQRCREVGIARAFAEKMLPAESLAQAEQMGLTPEEFLAMQRAAQQMPPALREVLAELAANGVEIRSQEDLEAALAARPDLQAKLAAAIGGAGGGLNIPPEFRDDLQAATEAEQRYRRSGNQTALDSAAAAWERILGAASFRAADARFRLAAFNNAGGVFLRRYWARGRLPDLNRALELWQRAVTGTPPDSPDLPMNLNNLGNGLRARYARTGRLEDLEEAIKSYQRAVTGTPPDSPDLPMNLNNLGNGLRARYARTGRLEDLEEAIKSYQRAVTGTPPDSPDLPSRLNNLGTGLSDRYARTGRLEDLEEAIKSYQRAVTGTPPDSPDLPMNLNNLGNGLRARYARTGRLEDLEEAIKSYQRAVTGTPPDSPDLPSRLNNLGNGLSDRYARTGRLEDLEEAIKSYQRAVTGTPPDSPDLPSLLNNLGTGLSDRYARTGRLEDLEEAINSYQRAVTGTPPDSPDLPSLLNNLGNGLRARYARTGRLEDLEEAITSYQRAVTGTPPDSPDLPSRLNNLGNGLRARYARTGRLEDLEEAIKSYQRAVTGTPPDSPDLPMNLNNLGTGLSDRYARTGRLEDLEEAIKSYQRAVTGTPPDSPDLPMNLNNLGNGLSDRYARTRRLEDLEEAIKSYQRAVTGTPPDSPDLPMNLNNLGNGLRARYARTGRLEDLEEAIKSYQRAVTGTPPDSPDLPSRLNNLGNGLRARYARTGRLEDLEEAIKSYRAACDLGAAAAPQEVLNAARNWGRWAVQRQQWSETAEAYGYGLTTGRQMLARQLQRSQKENTLADLQEMAAPAAYALTKLGKLEQAVAIAEGGRARLLGEAMERNRRDLEQLPSLGHAELHRRYLELVATQERLMQPVAAQPGQPDHLSGSARIDAIIAANTAFDQVVTEIQQIPGYADFLAEPGFARIQAAAQPGSPLVYLLATSAGGLALVVGGEEEHKPGFLEKPGLSPVTAIWLDDLSEAKLREVVYGPADDPALGGYLGAYDRWRRNSRSADARAAWHAALDATTVWLWNSVMAPVVDHLAQAGVTQAVLIPSGLLGLLPLHAAWTDSLSHNVGAEPGTPTDSLSHNVGEGRGEGLRRYALDTVTFSYAPSGLALSASQQQAQAVHTDGLLAVDNPDGSLLFSGQEVDAALSHFALAQSQRLVGFAATLDTVKQAISGQPVLHFSTHGWAGWGNPLQGGLLLAGDAHLTLEEMLALRLPAARLAVLSACETGIPGTKLPDEVIGLPAGLLQAGVAGVVASLWAVNDLSTARLMERFYQHWRAEGLAPAQALCQAQRWLRDVTRAELGDYYASFIARLPPAEAQAARAALIFTGDPNDRPYSHPYYWAGFTYSGA